MSVESRKQGYLLSLLCLACVGGLVLLFAILSVPSGDSYSSALQRLLVELVPNTIVALLAIPVVYFLLQRQGILVDRELKQDVAEEHYPPKRDAALGTNGRLRWTGSISWDTVCAAVDGLMEKIQNQGYAFDCVVTLTDGGLIVADLLLFNQKFRAGRDLCIPVICLNLSRTFGEHGKHIEIATDSYPVEYARRFSRLLIVDEASRSGKTIDAALCALRELYQARGIPPPEIRVAMLGVLEGGSPCSHFYELTLQGGSTYPWGPFAEYWTKVIH